MPYARNDRKLDCRGLKSAASKAFPARNSMPLSSPSAAFTGPVTRSGSGCSSSSATGGPARGSADRNGSHRRARCERASAQAGAAGGGFAETSYQTAYESRRASTRSTLSSCRNGKRDTLLGFDLRSREGVSSRSDEDRVAPHEGRRRGWVAPEGIEAAIALRNLYGTPATDRRVTSKIMPCAGALRLRRVSRVHVFRSAAREQTRIEIARRGSWRDEDQRGRCVQL